MSRQLNWRLWCHINEFRIEGYQNLPVMIALSYPLVLWSPAPKLIDYYHKRSPKRVCISTSKLADYVEAGYVVIVGREEWLLDPKYRNEHRWKFAKWSEDFDEKIKNIAFKDMSKPLLMRRVAIMPKEDGWDFADDAIKSGSPIIKEIESYIEENKLPPAYRGKIKKEDSLKDKVRLALRDIYNHANARVESGSDLTIVPWAEAPFYACRQALLSRTENGDITNEDENLRKLLEGLVKLMSKIGSFPQVEYLDEFLRKNYREELIEWLAKAHEQNSPLLKSDPAKVLEICLEESLNQGLLKKSTIDFILPRSWLLRGISAAGFALAFMEAYLGQMNLWGWLGLVTGLAPAGLNILRRVSLIPLTSEIYNGIRFIFVCTTGKENAYFNQIQRVLTRLRG